MNTTYEGVPIADLRFDETYWPDGSSEVMRRWIAEAYDPRTMPPLVMVRSEDGSCHVVGWSEEDAGPDYRWPLLLLAHNLLHHEVRDGRCTDPKCGLRFSDDDEEDVPGEEG